MKNVLVSGLLAAGLATGASAQGVSFSGGSVGIDTTVLFPLGGSGTPLQFSGVNAAAGADFTGSDWEFQIDGAMPAFDIVTEYNEVSFLLARQTGANAKLGAFVGVLNAGWSACGRHPRADMSTPLSV